MNTLISESKKMAMSEIDKVAGNAPDYNSEIEYAGLTLKRAVPIDAAKIIATDPDCQNMQKIMNLDPEINKLMNAALKWFNEIYILNCVENYYQSKCKDKSVGSAATRQHRNDDLEKVDAIIAAIHNFLETHEDMQKELANIYNRSNDFISSHLPCHYILILSSRYEIVK